MSEGGGRVRSGRSAPQPVGVFVLVKLLIRYLKPSRWLLVGVLAFQFASALASLYLPSLNADIIDNGLSRGDTAYIWSTGMFMLAVSLGQIVASVIATRPEEHTSELQ